MHFKKEEVPFPEWGTSMRSVQAGDMDIGYTEVHEPADCTNLYEGLPGGLCPCDHYGYVFSGSIRARYADGSEEIVRAGEVYWIPKGHVLIYDEPTKHLEINPHRELKQLMEVIEKNVKKLGTTPPKDSHKV